MQSYFNGRTRRSLFFSGKESNLLKPFWLFCVKNSFKYCCYKTFYCFFSRLLWSTKKFNFLRTFKVFFCEELFIGDRIFCTGQKRDHNVIKRFFISRFHCLGNVTSFSAKIFQFKSFACRKKKTKCKNKNTKKGIKVIPFFFENVFRVTVL